MQMKLSATPAVAGLLVLPIAGYATWQLMSDGTFGIDRDMAAEKPVVETTAPASGKSEQPQELAATQNEERERSFYDTLTQAEEAVQDSSGQVASSPRPAQPSRLLRSPAGGESKMMVLRLHLSRH